MRVLIDTDVLSFYFGRNKRTPVRGIEDILQDLFRENAVALSGHVYQEILYGIRSGQVGTYRKIRNALKPLFVAPTLKEFELAVEISRNCTTNGIQLSIADLMNCAISVLRGWPILTVDGDYEQAKKLNPKIMLVDYSAY
ncbi:MAG: PIN domain-containing protein [Pontiellaceae bacterium]|nr:PIN domain-containing protein [Pontiellaceae bacterium]